jgi:hypothetical protein
VAGEGHGVPGGVHRHVVVVEDQRVAIQSVLHVHGDVDRVGVVADRDVVAEVPDASQPAYRVLGRGPLGAVAHCAGQRQVAVLGRRLDAVRHGDVQRERVVGHRGQHRVVPVIPGRKHHFQVIMHVLDARDAPRRCRRLQVLRETGYGAVQRHLPVYVLHRDIRYIDERVIAEFQLHGVADILRFGHSRILSMG